VQLTEPLGDVTLVHFDAGRGTQLVAKVAPTTSLRSGDALTFRFAPEFCHLFSAGDGARLH
jgi:ABC-type sugar transport system ATPase subunit